VIRKDVKKGDTQIEAGESENKREMMEMRTDKGSGRITKERVQNQRLMKNKRELF